MYIYQVSHTFHVVTELNYHSKRVTAIVYDAQRDLWISASHDKFIRVYDQKINRVVIEIEYENRYTRAIYTDKISTGCQYTGNCVFDSSLSASIIPKY